MRWRVRALLAMIVSLTVALLAPIAVSQEGAASTRLKLDAHRIATLPSDPQGNIPTIIDSFAAYHFTAIYGGLVEVDNGHHIDVYLTALRSTVEATLRKDAPPGDLVFLKTPHSLQHMDRIHQRLVARSERLIRGGIKLTEWWPQIQNGREMIGIEGLKEQDILLLDRMLGASNIKTFNMPPDMVPVLTAGRANDSSPWKGGDYITDFSFGCTSAFSITIKGAKRLLTASHCFPSGNTISNLDVVTGMGNGNTIGTVGTRLTSSGSADAEVINANSTGKVWTGIPTSTSLADIAGTAANPVGGTVYQDGAYSGQTFPALTINKNNICIIPKGSREICHLVHAVATQAAEIANQEGDSGGPLIRVISGKTFAVGVVSASTTALTTPCQFNTPDTCFTDVYYSDIGSVLQELNGAIVKG